MNGLNPHALPHEPETSNDKLSSEAKDERKVQVEEWTTPKYCAREDNDAKTHDGNEERKNENKHDKLCEDDSEDEEDDARHCDVRRNNNKVKTVNKYEELTEKNMNKNIWSC